MPKLSVITINLNNCNGLKKTMESIYAQNIEDLEYIIIDGCSSDGSKLLIENNQHKIQYWESEKDAGVYNAMNKGIKHATGDYILFLNSGDHLKTENTLSEVYPELDGTCIVYGHTVLVESNNKSWTGYNPSKLSFEFFVDFTLPHCSSFIKRSLFDQVGFYDEQLEICADWKFFIDAICRYNISYKMVDKEISTFYLDGLSSKPENAGKIRTEKKMILDRDYSLFMPMYEKLVELKKKENTKLKQLVDKIQHRLRKLAVSKSEG